MTRKKLISSLVKLHLFKGLNFSIQLQMRSFNNLAFLRDEKLKQLANSDSTQLSLLSEECILVDVNDKTIGSSSKKNCHLIENINNGMLHRAFSVFLFDSQQRLLLQKRSPFKLTYPNHWTNTCCSHPLYFEKELDESNESIGIKHAAIRRLNYELGIQNREISIDSILYLTRIHYKADNVPFDNLFAEHEIDYVLFINGDFSLKVNKNEISDVLYVSQADLREILHREKLSNTNEDILLTPWFKMIANKLLFNWWNNLNNLNKYKEHNKIHRFI